jgi:hypothetical protein
MPASRNVCIEPKSQCALNDLAERRERTGGAIGQARGRCKRRANEQIQMETDAECRRGATLSHAIVPAGAVHHHRRGRHGAGVMGLEDSRCDGRRKAEIIGIDDQPRASGRPITRGAICSGHANR